MQSGTKSIERERDQLHENEHDNNNKSNTKIINTNLNAIEINKTLNEKIAKYRMIIEQLNKNRIVFQKKIYKIFNG